MRLPGVLVRAVLCCAACMLRVGARAWTHTCAHVRTHTRPLPQLPPRRRSRGAALREAAEAVGDSPGALVWKSNKAATHWFYNNNIAEKYPGLRAALEELDEQARADGEAWLRELTVAVGGVSAGEGGCGGWRAGVAGATLRRRAATVQQPMGARIERK